MLWLVMYIPIKFLMFQISISGELGAGQSLNADEHHTLTSMQSEIQFKA